MMTFLVVASLDDGSYVMMMLYVGFVVWMTLEAFGVTSILGVRAGP